jgi:hypothetical protein
MFGVPVRRSFDNRLESGVFGVHSVRSTDLRKRSVPCSAAPPLSIRSCKYKCCLCDAGGSWLGWGGWGPQLGTAKIFVVWVLAVIEERRALSLISALIFAGEVGTAAGDFGCDVRCPAATYGRGRGT